MRLTRILLHWKHKKQPGHVWRGKNRRVKEPTLEDLNALRIDFQREERNMLILRHPYLSVEQGHGYMKDLRPPINMAEVGNKIRISKFNKHFSWTDQLVHLRVTDCWE